MSEPGVPVGAESRALKAAGLAMLALGSVPLVHLAWRASAAAESGAGLAALWPGMTGLLLLWLGGNMVAAGLLVMRAGFNGRRPWEHPRRLRALAWQALLANLALPVLTAGLMTSEPALEAEVTAAGWAELGALLVVVLVVLGLVVLRRARRLEADSADAVLARDPRAPVLYLRSFASDGDAAMEYDQWPWWRLLMRWLPVATPEQELADHLDAVGPVVAIGRPGEPLPELGAARLYVEHDAWQATVLSLMERARLLVLRVGSTEGLLWEIDQALRRLPRERLVLVVLGERQAAPAVRARLAEALGVALPEVLPAGGPARSLWHRIGLRHPKRRVGCLVCFPGGGAARVVNVTYWPIDWQSFGLSLMGRINAGPLRRAFSEVSRLLGLPGGDVRGSHGRAVAVMLALILGMVGAHWFYLGRRRRGWAYVALAPLALSALLGWADALRFMLENRSEFAARMAPGARG